MADGFGWVRLVEMCSGGWWYSGLGIEWSDWPRWVVLFEGRAVEL